MLKSVHKVHCVDKTIKKIPGPVQVKNATSKTSVNRCNDTKDLNGDQILNEHCKKLNITVNSNEKCNIKEDSFKKKGDSGLKTPGSNWEKYKNIVKSEVNSQTQNTEVKKKKRQRRRYKPAPTNLQHFESKDEQAEIDKTNKPNLENKEDEKKLTRVIAMDCEMVGIGNGEDSMVARVSLVNSKGVCIYDKYVKPTEIVQDYRTEVSGIRPDHLQKGEEFKTVQNEVAEILKGRILVGHALKNDLQVLYLSHPKRYLRDTSRYKPFRKFANGGTPSLKKLALELLDTDIQKGEHNSVEDARAALQIYLLFRKKWELEVRSKR